MMGFKDEMDTDWTEAQQAANVHAVRQHMTAARDDLLTHQAKMQAEIDDGKFSTVHAEIRTEGLAVKKIIDDAVADLASHSEFIDWKQPTEG